MTFFYFMQTNYYQVYITMQKLWVSEHDDFSSRAHLYAHL